MSHWPTLLIEPAPPVAAPRKLHAQHFAFLRGYVQGLDLGEIWTRYLAVEGDRRDPRVVARTIKWLRDEFAAASKRHHKHGIARLVRIDLERTLKELGGDSEAPVVSRPSIEQFIHERDYEGFRIEEILPLYYEEYGAPSANDKRGARLVKKLLDGLIWLEGIIAESPKADDGVGAWLNPDLAVRLEDAGLVTLRQLAERINGVGQHWHAGVRAIGTGKADRIVSWLQAWAGATCLPIGPHALRVARELTKADLQLVVPAQTAVVPLEKFRVPHELDGSVGQFRAPRAQCQLTANNDYAALLEFLREKQGREEDSAPPAPGDHPLAWLQQLGPTARAYRIECERFMLWAILVRGKALSSMAFEDVTAYRDFLKDPQPSERWCGARGRARWGPAWRPFEGPLAPAARRRAITMLGTFYKFLVDQRYLTGNPWTGVAKPRAPARSALAGKSFTFEQWDAIGAMLEALPPTSANQRLRVALPLMRAGRLRRAEAVAARVRDLHWLSLPATRREPAVAGWLLEVRGKGDKLRLVALADELILDLQDYLAERGLKPDLQDPAIGDVYLLGQALDLAKRAPWALAGREAPRPGDGIGAQTLYDQLKSFFRKCADHMEHSDRAGACALRAASTHWLRHTGITHSLAEGTPPDLEMAAAGHNSLDTTGIYSHAEARRMLSFSTAFQKNRGA